MISLKIDVLKIDKAHLFKGAKGTYLDACLHENKEGRDQYDNDGFVTQGVSKEARAAGERGPIIGNWRHVEQKAKPPAPPPRAAALPKMEDPGDEPIF